MDQKADIMDMPSTQTEQLIKMIEQVPLVGSLWADAIYTFIGVNDALHMRELRDDRRIELPAGPNIVDLVVQNAPETTQRAA